MQGLAHRFGVCSIVLAFGALAPGIAAAESAAFSLAWDAPPECPSTPYLETEVARLLGDSRDRPPVETIEATAQVTHAPTWIVAIVTRQGTQTGRRSIEAASCQELANATALILALMIDPQAVAAQAREPQREEPAPAAPSPPRPSPEPDTPPLDVLAALHVQGRLGTLPGWDVGGGAGLGLSGPRWRIMLFGTYGLRRPTVSTVGSPPGAHGQFHFLAAAFAGCVNLGEGPLSIGPCATMEVGSVSAKGYGYTSDYVARTTWLALGAGGYVAIALGPHLAIPIHVDVLAPLRRPEYIIEDVPGHVFQAPRVGGRLLIGIELRF